MGRIIKSTSDADVVTAKSFDGKHEIAFSETSHRYKWLCACHKKASAVGTTTFTKAGYPTSMGLVTWMRGETAEWLFDQLTVPGDDATGFYPREGYWPVTNINRIDLVKQAKKADRGTAQKAADIGTLTHAYAELHSIGQITEATDLLDQVRTAEAWPIIESCVTKYREWALQNRGTIVRHEDIIASPNHNFCGKFDRLDRVNGKLVLRDYKTSKAIFLEQYIQLGAYSLAIKEWLGLNVEGLEVLRFGKEDGEFETLLIDKPEEIKMFEEQAIRCRQTYEFAKMNEDPRFKRYRGKA